ncbi:MAG: transposase [Gemmatimonadota bacterium]|nr:transposase [Caldilineaceae bacterium]MDE2810725.1 transposase [Gemmatimonadota bacterium]
MPLKEAVSRHWFRFQRELFPWLDEALGALVERLRNEATLRRLCGWEKAGSVPSEATFSRAFGEFAEGDLPGRLHEALLERTLEGHLAGHVSRDSTAIAGREKPAPKAAPAAKPKRRVGRPPKGDQRPKELSRLQRQGAMTLDEMLEELPKGCDIGVKSTGKGYLERWTGYKLHLDAIDGGIPISCLLTSASVHDSQAAIPLATLTARRVTSLYDLMDSAYDAPEIRAFSQKLGHVPIIDTNPRRRVEMKAERKREALAGRCIGHRSPEARRYRERTTVERVNGRLKDEFGGRHVRVRGPGKVMCHLMFGILALTVEQLMRLIL